MTERVDLDGVLVIGAGLAGLTAALAAAPRRVLVLSATPLGEGCASSWAQGGMAAALAADDDPALHAADTIAAGAGLCKPEAVAILTREGPAAVRALAALGAPFDRAADGGFVQSLEAAHSRPRVARVGGDGAGLAIMHAVIAVVRRAGHIQIHEDARAVSLIQDAAGRVLGAMARIDGQAVEFRAAATVLATGGLGGLYAVTTNPREARGEGLALAALAGAAIVDPEFVQFHPTAIDTGADPAPLATEALRGEGARLVDATGAPFMDRYSPAGDLAPRDIVARAIVAETRRGGAVFLDARAALGAEFEAHFPAVFAACMAAGIDPGCDLIPVKPAAHYHMGGIGVDVWGRASIEGLFAVGECAATGVHGANRLASNSLLEAVVFGRRAGEAAKEIATRSSPVWPTVGAAPELPAAVLAQLRARMTAEAGVVRDAAGLAALLGWIDEQSRLGGPALPLIAADLVAKAALDRRESRGGHFRSDFPESSGEGCPLPTWRRDGTPGPRGLSELPDLLIEPLVRAALAEDLGHAGDITSHACIAADARLTAVFAARTGGVIAGLACARLAIRLLDPDARFDTAADDGETVAAGAILARVEANARALLGAERVALNLICRLSGIATLTAAFVARTAGTRARIVDTRKTTPGLRALEKYAVRRGGGANHRFGLDDAVLIKDNHVAACGGVGEAVRRARAAVGHMVKIEVEIDRMDQLEAALAERPDIVMLDNFSLADLDAAVRAVAGRALIEASGGVSLETVAAIAATGVDLISVGALTHSAPILDIGLDAA